MSALCPKVARALISLFAAISLLSAWIFLPPPAQADSLSSSPEEPRLASALQVTSCDNAGNDRNSIELCTPGDNGAKSPLRDGALRLQTTSAERDGELGLAEGYEIGVELNPSLFTQGTRYLTELTSHSEDAAEEQGIPTALSIESSGQRRFGTPVEENTNGAHEFYRGFSLEVGEEDLVSGHVQLRFADLGFRSLRLRILEAVEGSDPSLISEAEFTASIEAPASVTQSSAQAPVPSALKTAPEKESAQSGASAVLPNSREARESAAASSSSGQGQASAVANSAEHRLTLDHGHIDLFYMTLDDQGHPVLKVMEDVTGSGVQHEAEEVRLVVPSSALKHSLPQDIVAGGSGYFLPQTQDPTLPWPGWDVLSLAPAGFERVEFDVSYTNSNGGRISLWTEDFVAGRSSRLRTGGYELDPNGSTIVQDYLSHTHANWAFSQAGSYELSVQARAYRNDGSFETTRSAHYLIEVGGAQGVVSPKDSKTESGGVLPPAVDTGKISDDESLTRNAPQRLGAERCIPTRITREANEDEISRIRSDNETPNQAITTLNVQVGSEGGITDGHFDLGPAIENGQLVARIKDDRAVPAVWKDPASMTFALGEKAKIKAPEALSYAASVGQDVWMIPATQIRGVPWLGMNSQREEIVTETSGQVRFSLLDVQGPGNVAVFESGSLGAGIGTHVFDGAGTSYTLPANTHAHQNWVFTEPGSYQLTIAMNVTPRGKDLRGSGSGATGSLIAAGGTGEHGRPLVYAIVGRTASGQPCSLASTGAGTAELAPMILAALLIGFGCIATSTHMRVRR
ncbi:TIGR03773 family transporter-associated surface protein [uncultured Actinomyces sp.]|uniref:TIGR03773 family transporter-associated surface protein n=1 Tax=uncultured Actinomyces sp. TaxID=249061 RepID=UPI0026148580|nr:TIGR03773 family transporter-associated surface protein [uncultured Actinomyces sp.]